MKGDDLGGILDKLRTSPENARIWEARRLELSIHILASNSKRLIDILDVLNSYDNTRDLLSIRNRYKFTAYSREVLLLLHNFVASALSLFDHLRNQYRMFYKPGNLMPEFQEEIDKRFKTNTAASFTIGLQKYCQHYRVPQLLINVEFAKSLSCDLCLRKSDLLDFDGWPSAAKNYINGQKDLVPFRDPCEQYSSDITQFCRWFTSQQNKIHAEDIASVKVLQDKAPSIMLGNIPRQVRANWHSDKLHLSIGMIEQGFLYIFSDAQWAELDATPATPSARCEKIISMIRGMGVIDPEFEGDIKDKFRSIL